MYQVLDLLKTNSQIKLTKLPKHLKTKYVVAKNIDYKETDWQLPADTDKADNETRTLESIVSVFKEVRISEK